MAQATFRIYNDSIIDIPNDKIIPNDKNSVELRVENRSQTRPCIYDKTTNNTVEAHIETIYASEDNL